LAEPGGLHPYLRFGFIENLHTVRRIPVGRLWGIRVSVTPVTWLFPFIFLALGLALNVVRPYAGLADRFAEAGLLTLAVAVGTLVHALGHILGGLLVHNPMDELLLTATRGVNLYPGDQSKLPSAVHLGRSLGGPVLNLIAGALLLALARLTADSSLAALLDRIASTNLYIGFGAFLPLPSIDGQVIWREVGRLVQANMRH
jgi:hypothetical protein